MAGLVSLARLGLAVAGRLGNVIANVERIHSSYKAGEDIPRQVPAVLDSCKKLKLRFEEHPHQDIISKDLFEQIERMGQDIRELAKKCCSSHQSPAAASNRATRTFIRRRVRAAVYLVDFQTEVLNTFTRAERLLLVVLDLMTHDEVHRLTGCLQELSVHARAEPLTASGDDRWVGGKRTLPPKERFMLGPEKLGSIANLKRAVMDSKAVGIVAAVGAQGMGGVGKTTACLVVSSDEEVGNVYGDAILWMSLGIAVTADTVVDQLAAIVESTGGVLRARLMRAMFKKYGIDKLDSVRDKAREWFYGRHVLLVVDNVLPAGKDSTTRCWVQFLKEVVGGNSCLLFSTRALKVTGESYVQITFKPLATSDHQKDVLFAHLGQIDAALQSSQIEILVEFCCGLPIALATAAALVRRLNFNWLKISRLLQGSIWDPSNPISGCSPRFSERGGHDGLAAVFSAGLRALDISSEASLHPDYSWTDLYLSLSFIDKSSARVPVGMLAILWGTDISVAEKICMGFQDMALGQLRTGNCPSSTTFEMHDLQLAYAAGLSGCEDMLDGQTASGPDLLALCCKVEGSFNGTWDQMHSECGCTAQLSSSADLALAREAAIWCYTVAVQVLTLGTDPHKWALTQKNMGDAWSERVLGDRAGNIERALACYDDAQQVWTREALPTGWAQVQMSMGVAWKNRVLGDRADNIERALACYQDTLQIWKLEDMPHDWALVHMFMGNTLCDRVMGDRADNIERALACYNDALQVRALEALPFERAKVQMNLGNAWACRVLGDRTGNIERALACYSDVLQVRSREEVPHDWALVQMNMGNALSDRVVGNSADNIERALACYNDALQIWTREAAPHEWATVQLNMGTAWIDRVLGASVDNIERALACYNGALQVWTREAEPHDWAKVQWGMGAAWYDLAGLGEDSSGNRKRALACWHDALQVFTPEAMPRESAIIKQDVDRAMAEECRVSSRGAGVDRRNWV